MYTKLKAILLSVLIVLAVSVTTYVIMQIHDEAQPATITESNSNPSTFGARDFLK